jgi:hypothetical protein
LGKLLLSGSSVPMQHQFFLKQLRKGRNTLVW